MNTTRTLAVVASFAALVLGRTASAQVSVPNTFTAGAPARAAEVNANFQALVTAVNDLSSRVSKLEGQITAADLAGTYAYHEFQTQLTGGTSSHVSAYTSSGGTATLAADGTGTFANTDEQGHDLMLPDGSLTPIYFAHAGGTFTWTLTGGKVSLFGLTFSVADGGRLLICTNVGTDGTNALVLLVRTN